ncbi:MAG: hypothetical protein Ct9H90mP4_11890 [Gammaproteobacteria bacterium]|nr:MAG: hypothetical protein Ct9H90mP4_11890 [Gammaproteobacteria bacterium]
MEQIVTVGRRKTSKARVFLTKGKGDISVNKKELADYFPREVAQMLVKQPLEKVDMLNAVDIIATVKGGGILVKQGLFNWV